MKTTILLILSATLLCFTAPAPRTIELHQPDFTEAHFYSFDSIFVVQEFNAGSAYTLQPGESFYDKCDYCECIDSVVTYWNCKQRKSDTISYSRRSVGYWTMYVNGRANGKAVVETQEEANVEVFEAIDDATGGDVLVKMHYMKTKVIDDIPGKISNKDRKYPEAKITKGDAQ